MASDSGKADLKRAKPSFGRKTFEPRNLPKRTQQKWSSNLEDPTTDLTNPRECWKAIKFEKSMFMPFFYNLKDIQGEFGFRVQKKRTQLLNLFQSWSDFPTLDSLPTGKLKVQTFETPQDARPWWDYRRTFDVFRLTRKTWASSLTVWTNFGTHNQWRRLSRARKLQLYIERAIMKNRPIIGQSRYLMSVTRSMLTQSKTGWRKFWKNTSTQRNLVLGKVDGHHWSPLLRQENIWCGRTRPRIPKVLVFLDMGEGIWQNQSPKHMFCSLQRLWYPWAQLFKQWFISLQQSNVSSHQQRRYISPWQQRTGISGICQGPWAHISIHFDDALYVLRHHQTIPIRSSRSKE